MKATKCKTFEGENEMDVIMYSTNCPKCKVLKTKLEDSNIKFTINNNIEQMEKLGIESVPVLSVDGELLDFSQSIKWINAMTTTDLRD